MVDRIRNTGVLGYALISEIDLAVLCNGNVLEEGVTTDSSVDVRLTLFVEVDNFCIATALEVEYTLIIPSVLVVTNKQTFRISTQRGLTGTGQTEEDSGVLALHVGVRRAVHRSNTLQRQVVVHHGEHTFLHLTAIPGVQNNLLAARGVECHTSLAVQTELFVVLNLCQRSIVDHEVRLEVSQLLFARLDEHVLYKVSLPCYLYDEANCHAGVLVSTAESIYYVQVLTAQLFDSQLFHLCPNVLGHRVVVVLVALGGPPNGVLRVLVHNDVFVLRRTAGVDTGHYVNRIELSVLTFGITGQLRLGLLCEQILVGRVVGDHCCALNTILGKI